MKTTKVTMAALAVAVMFAGGCKSDDTSTTSSSTTTPTTSSSSAVSAAPAATTSTAADNGIAALTADQIVKKAKAALTSAKSFHVTGSTTEDGQKMTVDMKVAGKQLVGTLNMGTAKLQMLAVGNAQYLKGNEAFWKESLGSASQAKQFNALVGDRWVKVPTGDKSLGGLFGLANANDLIDVEGKLTKGGAATVNGAPVITIKDSSGTLLVATTGTPYPLRMVSKENGTINFTDFGKTFAEIKAPATADVLDMNALSGK